uniref:Peptidoglycan-recognition protein n=1 Tax=Clastoptera arizonana TaxID=38151 RepID=A0A1B6DNH7_9HEMI
MFLYPVLPDYLHFISRCEWRALPPKIDPERIPAEYQPVPMVVIHHSALNNSCSGLVCDEVVRFYQRLHMDTNGWNDIGYNFLISPNGDVYEGRGWNVVGAHAFGYNSKSVGICLIGNFEEIRPTEEALRSAQELISLGTDMNMIAEDYELIGHRQVRDTLCPGENLFSVIKNWQHWSNISYTNI